MSLKRLVVLRHAKSDWDSAAETDHARPLNERGRQEAPAIAEKLAANGYGPEHVVASDSKRTTETFELARSHWPNVTVDFTEHFYHAGIEAVRAVAASVPANVTTLVVLGHNPGWEGVVHELSGRSVELKTANAAVLEVEAASFVDALAEGSRWRLVEIFKPRR